jgi:insertion element IS1 protein InsB
MKCINCKKKTLIRKGRRGIKQRYKYKSCGKYQQDIYSYRRYNSKDDIQIKLLNAEGVGIRSMSRILGYSKRTIIRRILYLASKVVKPIYLEYNQVYEVDEMWTFVGKKHPSHFSWITYAMNRKTNKIIDVAFGSRSKRNLNQALI